MTIVRLHQLPVDLFHAFEEQSDALLREYGLIASTGERPYSLTDVARAHQARAFVGERLAADLLERRDPAANVDLVVEVSGSVGPTDFAVLQGVLEDAARLASSGQMLTMPPLPEIVSLRNWICEEVIAQAAGGPPTTFALHLDVGRPDQALASWPDMADLRHDHAWIAGDDHNRIIGASDSALRLLGWERRDLVGQRVITVIAPSLRGRHVAGFTHAVVTGDHRILEQPVAVMAFTYSGEEVSVVLTLTRHRAASGRTVYLARLEPSDE